jgi:hypothetical protein
LLSLLSYPLTVGAPPHREETLKARKQWALRLATYAAITSAAFLGAAVGAVLILRRKRDEFAEESLHNLADLLSAEVSSNEPKSTDS